MASWLHTPAVASEKRRKRRQPDGRISRLPGKTECREPTPIRWTGQPLSFLQVTPSSIPVPVTVKEVPAVQSVQETVAVDRTVTLTGSVAVTNLPAVQQVAGTVNVGNLPVDGPGEFRDRKAPLRTPQPALCLEMREPDEVRERGAR